MRWQFWFQNKWLITYLKASSKEEVKSSWNIDEMDCDLSLAPSTLFFYHSFPCSADCKPKMLPLSFSSWIKLLFWSMFFHWKSSLNIKKKEVDVTIREVYAVFQIVYTHLATILTAWSGILRIVPNSVPYQEVQCTVLHPVQRVLASDINAWKPQKYKYVPLDAAAVVLLRTEKGISIWFLIFSIYINGKKFHCLRTDHNML